MQTQTHKIQNEHIQLPNNVEILDLNNLLIIPQINDERINGNINNNDEIIDSFKNFFLDFGFKAKDSIQKTNYNLLGSIKTFVQVKKNNNTINLNDNKLLLTNELKESSKSSLREDSKNELSHDNYEINKSNEEPNVINPLISINAFLKEFSEKSVQSLTQLKLSKNEEFFKTAREYNQKKSEDILIDQSGKNKIKNDMNSELNFENVMKISSKELRSKRAKSNQNKDTKSQIQAISHNSNEYGTHITNFKDQAEKNYDLSLGSLEITQSPIIKSYSLIEENIRIQKLKEAAAQKKLLEERLKLVNEHIETLDSPNHLDHKTPALKKKYKKLTKEELKEREEQALLLIKKINKEHNEKTKRLKQKLEKLNEEFKNEIEVTYKNQLNYEQKLRLDKKYEILQRLEKQQQKRKNEVSGNYQKAQSDKKPSSHLDNNDDNLPNLNDFKIRSSLKSELSLPDLQNKDYGILPDINDPHNKNGSGPNDIKYRQSPHKQLYQSSILKRIKEIDFEKKTLNKRKQFERKMLHGKQIEYGKLIKSSTLPKIENLPIDPIKYDLVSMDIYHHKYRKSAFQSPKKISKEEKFANNYYYYKYKQKHGQYDNNQDYDLYNNNLKIIIHDSKSIMPIENNKDIQLIKNGNKLSNDSENFNEEISNYARNQIYETEHELNKKSKISTNDVIKYRIKKSFEIN